MLSMSINQTVLDYSVSVTLLWSTLPSVSFTRLLLTDLNLYWNTCVGYFNSSVAAHQIPHISFTPLHSKGYWRKWIKLNLFIMMHNAVICQLIARFPAYTQLQPQPYLRLHYYLLITDYNFSHRIHHFSFGDSAGGRVNPLDGDDKVTNNGRVVMVFNNLNCHIELLSCLSIWPMTIQLHWFHLPKYIIAIISNDNISAKVS